MSETATFACRRLRLRDFRNFADLELEIPPEGVVLVGDNGAGKTNLLEGLYYLEILRSFRGAADDELVRFGADVFHVRGQFQRAGDPGCLEIGAAFERRTRRKRVTLGGAPTERLGDAIGRVGVVVFSPSDTGIISGPPAGRRRFLDIVLSVNRPGYLDVLQRYRHVLRQRNALLRRRHDPRQLAAWDDGLVDAGARVMVERARWLESVAPGFSQRVRRIGGSDMRLSYEPDVTPPADGAWDAGEAATALRQELARRAQREQERGMTLTGPHRDDLAFTMTTSAGDVDLRRFGSGGQQRTAALALRMIEAGTVRTARGGEPIILLDDVFAELDPGRSRRILEILEEEERGQVVLTSPKASDLEVRSGSLERWSMAGGSVTR
jgi:DNA replication and repair protein RecF